MINIEVKNSIRAGGERSGFISFPYNNDIVNIMRNQRVRFWHSDTKQWEVPYDRLSNAINDLIEFPITIVGENIVKEKPVILPKGFEFKTKPFDHQMEGYEYGMKKERFLLADEMGLGKTKQAIDLGLAKRELKGYKHCLIICGVNGLKWNWLKEIKIHSDEIGHIIGSRINNKGRLVVDGSQEKLADIESQPDNFFWITNIESLRYKEETGKTRFYKGKEIPIYRYPIREALQKLCDEGIINMIVVDEIHKAKNAYSQQGYNLLKLEAETMIAMTGTPLMNSPLDLYMVMKWLGYEKHSFNQFKSHYCRFGGFGGYEVIGYKNLDVLQEEVDKIMLRRLKKDVLDLPEKTRMTEYVEMTEKQNNIYYELLAEIRRDIDKIKLSNNPLAQLIRLRQATGWTGILSSEIAESAKINRLEELADELIANGEKVIVFSNWLKVLKPAIKRMKKYNPAVICGETKDIVAEQDKFKNDNSCKMIFGTTSAMGTGITLTSASTVIFLDSPWNRALKEQAEDRAHRIGQKNNVQIITLVCHDTIDERIEELVYEKGQMADEMIDKINVSDKQAVVDYLLS